MHPLEKKIIAKQKELHAADERVRAAHREVAVLQAEIAAYTEALSYVLVAPSDKKAKSKPHRTSPLNDDWKKILQDLLTWGRLEFGYQDIAETASALKIEINMDSARTVMMDSINNGILDRVKNGRFRFTEEAGAVLQISKSEGSAASAAQPSNSSESQDDVSDLI